MDNRQNRSRAKTKRENGAVLVFVTISLVALVGFAAWATETGRVWQTKSQLQAAADSAALAGVENLLSADFLTVDEAGARTEAITYGAQHQALGTDLAIAVADVQVGSWDMASQTFTALPGNTDPDVMRAVRVITRRDGSLNEPVDTILGRDRPAANAHEPGLEVRRPGLGLLRDHGGGFQMRHHFVVRAAKVAP